MAETTETSTTAPTDTAATMALEAKEFRAALKATLAPIMATETRNPALAESLSGRLRTLTDQVRVPVVQNTLDHVVERMARSIEGTGQADLLGLYAKVLGAAATGGMLTVAERKFAGFMANLLEQNYLRDPANKMTDLIQASMQRLTTIANPIAGISSCSENLRSGGITGGVCAGVSIDHGVKNPQAAVVARLRF